MRIKLPLYDCAPDVIQADAAAGIWSDAQGVQFRAGMAERVAPAQHVYAEGEPEGPYLAILSIGNASGEFYWIAATAAGVYATDGAEWLNITPEAWATGADSIITMHGFNGVAIINDSIGGPFYWDVTAGSTCEPLPGWPEGWRVASMRSHSGFLFGIGRLDMGGGQRVCWSDAAEAGTLPGTWEPAAENFAGWIDLLPAVSPCIDGVTLGNDFLVFKGESIHAFTFAGGNDVFLARVRFATVGIASVGAFCRGPSERLMFAGSQGDVIITDGVSWQSVLNGKASRRWYAEVEPQAIRGLIQGASLSRLGLSLMGFALRGEEAMTKALIYDWATGAISWRSLPACRSIGEGRVMQDVAKNAWDELTTSWDDWDAVWAAGLVAATGDDVMVGGAGLWLISDQDAAGEPDPVYLLKTAASLGNDEAHKLIRRVFPRIRGSGVVSVRVGASAEAEGPIEWSAPVDYPIGQNAHVDLFRRGRFVSLEIQSKPASGAGFQVGAVELEASEAGKW